MKWQIYWQQTICHEEIVEADSYAEAVNIILDKYKGLDDELEGDRVQAIEIKEMEK